MRLRQVLILFVLIGAGICAVFAVRESIRWVRSSQPPEEISLRDLIKRGPKGNPNIILKDFSIFSDFISEKRYGEWAKVWVPIVPTGGDDSSNDKPAIRAFLYSENIRSDAEAHQQLSKTKLQCTVNNDAPKPQIVASMLIAKSYPGTNPETCIIIEEGAEPAGTLKLSLYAIGAAVLIGLCPLIWYMPSLFEKEEVRPRVKDDYQSTGRRLEIGVLPPADALPIQGWAPRRRDK